MDSSRLLVCKFKTALLFLTIILLSGCSGSSGLINLGIAKDEVINYHNSGRYEMDIRDAVDKAIEKFDAVEPAQKAAVVFDVDETAITSYDFYKKWDFAYVPRYFDMWVDSAKAPAIPSVLDLYNYLLKRKFKVIFITGRKNFQYESTFKNLVSSGYSGFDTLITKGAEYAGQTAEKFKSEKRSELVENGYTIEGTVGDQWSDLKGPYHGIQVKIPNYMYIIY
jgi:acid phosphatase